MNSKVIRILFYNAVLTGLGSYLISAFFPTASIPSFVFFFLIGLLVFDSFTEKRNLGKYGLGLPRLRDVKTALIIFSLFFPISIASRILIPTFDYTYSLSLGLNSTTFTHFLLFVIPIGILTEEIGIRSLFQSKMADIFGSRLAIYATIINFTLLHFGWFFISTPANFFIILASVFFYSIFLALLFESTRSVFLTMLVHFFVNVVSAYQIIFHVTGQVYSEIILWASWGIYFVLVGPMAFNFLRDTLKTSKPQKLKSSLERISFILLSIFSIIAIIILRYF